jgi:hypothetical protein
MVILRRSSRWPLPKLPESKVQTESRAWINPHEEFQ